MAIHNVPFLNARVVNCFPRPHAIKIDMSTQFITRNLTFIRLTKPTQKMPNMWINIVSLSDQASYFMPYKNQDFDVRHEYLNYVYVRKN